MFGPTRSTRDRRLLGAIGGAWLVAATLIFALPPTPPPITVVVAEPSLRPWVADVVASDPSLSSTVRLLEAAQLPAGISAETAGWIGLGSSPAAPRSAAGSAPGTVVARSPYVVVVWEQSRDRLGLQDDRDGAVDWRALQRALAEGPGSRFVLPGPSTPLGADGLALLALGYYGPHTTDLPAGALDQPGLRAWLRPFYQRQTRLRCDERVQLDDWARYRTTLGDAGLLPEHEALALVPVVDPQARLHVRYPAVTVVRTYVFTAPSQGRAASAYQQLRTRLVSEAAQGSLARHGFRPVGPAVPATDTPFTRLRAHGARWEARWEEVMPTEITRRSCEWRP